VVTVARTPFSSPLSSVAFVYAGACIVTLAILPHLQGPLRTYDAAHHGGALLGKEPLEGLFWGLGAGGALAAAGQAVTRWTAWGRRFERLLARLMQPLHVGDALLLALLSGLAEELVFRGLALPYLGLVASSLLFGIAHLIPRRGLWPWSVWAAGAGGVLGWTALETGGLLAPIVAHVLVNALGLLLLAGGRKEADGEEPEP
jgi:uncharacterized protein